MHFTVCDFTLAKESLFQKFNFPRKFKKSEAGIVHSIEATKFVVYEDNYGLAYWIVNESGDFEYKKGDLFFIEYGLPNNKE